MGGNKKQRTKGNVKPSSSRRTAELLSASGVTGFVGFSGLATNLPGYVPPSGQQINDDIESSVDGDFRLVMRKMTKRDSVTKVKALQEFSVLCQEKDDELVKGALPFWPRLYNKLATNNDRRLREATHIANEQLLIKVKKNVAPYLKSMMGVWLVSLCDPYAPASTAARNALNSAIPVAKQPGAFDFCKEDIFNSFQDILLAQTAKKVSEEKEVVAELEEKYSRMVAGCLKALKLFLGTVEVQDTNRERIHELLRTLLDEDKFWKYAKHTESQIRSSWYGALSGISQFLGVEASRYASKMCPLTLGRLAEGDPVVAPLIWEASLIILVNIEDCWDHVNPNKAFLPQLWNFLKEGGKGNASAIFPSLLPLLSKIPSSVLGDYVFFYNNIFTNLRQGLFLDKVQSSPSETNAVVSAFVECLKYVYVRHCSSSHIDIAIRENLLVNQLLPILKTPISDSHNLYSKLGSFLLYLESELKNEASAAQTIQVLSAFWQQFVELCETIMVGKDVEVQSAMLSNLASFFHSLHSPVVKAVRAKVKFDLPNTEDSSTEELMTEKREWTPNSPLVISVQILCSTALRELETNPSAVLANLLYEMCAAVCSKELFSMLATHRGSAEKTFSDDEASIVFFKSQVLPLLLQNSANKDLVRHLVSLAFVVCSCTTKDYVFSVLHDLCMSKDAVILEEVICKAAQSRQGPFRDWLRSDEVGELVLEMAQQLANVSSTEHRDGNYTDSSWKVLNLCLASSKHSEPLIRTEYLRKLLDIFHTSIQNLLPACREQSSDTTQVIEFVCDLALSLFDSCMDCWCIPAVEKLLLTLFHFSCHSNDSPVPAKEKVERTWCSGTKKLVSLRGGLLNEDGFLYQACTKVHDIILTEHHLEDRMEAIETLAKKLLTSVYEALPESRETENCLLLSATICSHLQVILPSEDDWCELELSTNKDDLFVQLLRGEVTLAPFESEYETHVPNCGSLFRVAGFVLRLLRKMLGDKGDDCTADESKSLEYVTKHLIFISLAVSYVRHFHMDGSKDFPIMNDLINVFGFFKWEETKDFLDLLALRAMEKGCMWSMCLGDMVSWLKETFPLAKNWCKSFVQKIEFTGINGSASTFHTLQCLSPQLENKSSEELFSKVICHLVSIEDVLSSDSVGYLTLLSRCQFTDELSTALEFLKGLRNTRLELFLSDRPFTSEDSDAIVFCASVATFFQSVVVRKSGTLSHSHWDLILCSLTGWMESCEKNQSILLQNPLAVLLACQALRLLHSTSQILESEEAARLCEGELVAEWKMLYLESIRKALLPLFFWLAGVTTCGTAEPIRELLKSLALDLQSVTIEDVAKHCWLGSGSSTSFHEIVDYGLLASLYYPFLKHNLYPVQLIGHHICDLLIGNVPHAPDDSLTEESQDEKMRLPPPFMVDMLGLTTPVVETILSDLLVGDCCLVQPGTDTFTYTQAYLFTWLHMLKFFNTASSEVRSEYATYLQKQKYLQSLLVNLFRLMPQNPALSEKVTVTPTRGCCGKTMFTEPFEMDVRVASSHGLQHLACRVYLETLRKLPAMVRQWWTNQDNRTTDIVNKYTTDYVSSYICAQEIKCVQLTDVKFENMTVRARPITREVVARYSVDEITIELVICLPPNHPLGPVRVETCQRVGVGQTQWRNWLLQLITFLTYQNGSILDGLSLWKCNVDKRFEGVEECMICFYVLHGSTCQLPKLMCKTCKKKYHSACLYKWFSTSNKSACPLCRNLF